MVRVGNDGGGCFSGYVGSVAVVMMVVVDD